MKTIFSFILVVSVCWNIIAQPVMQTKEINVRNDFAYYYMPVGQQKIALLRDKLFKCIYTVYNEHLHEELEQEIYFKGKKWKIWAVNEYGPGFQILYSYKEDGVYYLQMLDLDERAEFVKEKTIWASAKLQSGILSQAVFSEDYSKAAIYLNGDERVALYVYDFQQDTVIFQHTDWSSFSIAKENFEATEISNAGICIMHVTPVKGRSNKENEFSMLWVNARQQIHKFIDLEIESYFYLDLFSAINNKTNAIIFHGSYSEKRQGKSLGFYTLALDQHGDAIYTKIYPFTEELNFELTGKKERNDQALKSITVNACYFREDGGFLVFSEAKREYFRRPAYAVNTEVIGGSQVRWIDFYYDDIIVNSFSKNGDAEWSKVLHKKQYSQDDNAMYSSYFIMRSPSVMRLVFNDEIKIENTVSEYLIRSDGANVRKSVLNTSYQNLNLRMVDALQLSPSELIVPNEKNNRLSLVKLNLL